jgi:hypothetical protein
MNFRTNNTDAIKRMLSMKEAAAYMGLGMNSTRTLVSNIGAAINVGKRVVIDRYKLDDYIESSTTWKQGE